MTIKGGKTRKNKVIPLTSSGLPLGHKTTIHKSKTGKTPLFLKSKRGTRRYIRR